MRTVKRRSVLSPLSAIPSCCQRGNWRECSRSRVSSLVELAIVTVITFSYVSTTAHGALSSDSPVGRIITIVLKVQMNTFRPSRPQAEWPAGGHGAGQWQSQD